MSPTRSDSRPSDRSSPSPAYAPIRSVFAYSEIMPTPAPIASAGIRAAACTSSLPSAVVPPGIAAIRPGEQFLTTIEGCSVSRSPCPTAVIRTASPVVSVAASASAKSASTYACWPITCPVAPAAGPEVTVTSFPTQDRNWTAMFARSEEHTSELQSRPHLVCRLLLEKKKYLHEMIRHHQVQPRLQHCQT